MSDCLEFIHHSSRVRETSLAIRLSPTICGLFMEIPMLWMAKFLCRTPTRQSRILVGLPDLRGSAQNVDLSKPPPPPPSVLLLSNTRI